ncbi:cell wall-binding repeat-containing protein [Kineococcus aurantiacus]|uniref:Putative cell wall-binding protein n=1 Tax=Kineococcus aurantiacus TaxID=37633 RepID=A0A7Y9J1U7_9ACTN|nr:cell wall-binding repeat-containing protein [Kineococcus aurantiacus]NYD23393.1 putative cell wall-binding protein [Kineococcus aurantiacus]
MRLRPRTLGLAAALALSTTLVAGAAPATASPGVDLKAAQASRVYGADRVGTAVAASKSFSGGAADAVVLTRSDTFADALAGAPLASDKGGPLLMTSRTALQPEVAAAIRDTLKSTGTVYLLGDGNALSAGVEDAVRALGFRTQRVSGSDRFGTAVEIAKLLPAASTVSVVTGWNFPDGLAAGSLMGVVDTSSAHSIGVVLLSDGANLGPATQGYLAGRAFDTKLAVGGTAVTAVRKYETGWAELAGADRYDTAALVAKQFTSSAFFKDATTVIGVATGENWPDALAGSALLAYAGGPMLLTAKASLPASTRGAIDVIKADAVDNGRSITDVLVFGDQNSVSDAAYDAVVAAAG